jgi:hypothetical protein
MLMNMSDSVREIVEQIGKKNIKEILDNLHSKLCISSSTRVLTDDGLSAAGYDQQDIYQSILLLVDFLPVCASH